MPITIKNTTHRCKRDKPIIIEEAQTDSDKKQTNNTIDAESLDLLKREIELDSSIKYEKKLAEQVKELKDSYDEDLRRNIDKISNSYNKIISDLDKEHKKIVSIEKPKLVRQVGYIKENTTLKKTTRPGIKAVNGVLVPK